MKVRLLSSIILLLGWGTSALAQSDKALLRELAQDNQQSIEALALYPKDARIAILETAKYPEVLIKMQSIREKTSAAFRTLIEDYPRSTQDVFYDLTRYPGLVADLVARQHNREAEHQALEVLPEEKRSEAYGIVEREAGTLSKINDLNRTAQSAYDNLIAGYTAPAQQAFRTLLDLPEVVDILNEDLRFTVLVGDVYREDPTWVIHKMDSLSLAVARTHAAEQEEWKKSVENDPKAQEELQSATAEYAAEYGYTDEIYNFVSDDVYAAPAPARVERHNYYHYPYWFGYPWWEPQPFWRPYPYWWYWGFYPDQRNVVVVYLPSYHFVHWYFHRPHHHYKYNHLSTHFVNHYYGHRNSGTTISAGVGEWRNQNRTIISDDLLKDKTRLPERLKEYGRFEEGRQKFNTKNPARALTSEQYLEKNARQYPELKRSRTAATTEIQRERAAESKQRSDWAPTKEPAKPEIPPARVPRTDTPDHPQANPTPAPRTKPTIRTQQPAPRPVRTAPPPAQKPTIDEAKEYHRDKWLEPKRPAVQPQKQPVQKPKTQPVPRKEMPAQAPKTQKSRGGG